METRRTSRAVQPTNSAGRCGLSRSRTRVRGRRFDRAGERLRSRCGSPVRTIVRGSAVRNPGKGQVVECPLEDRPMVTPAPQPEHERRNARRVALPFVLAAAIVALVIAVVFGVTRPWEDS